MWAPSLVFLCLTFVSFPLKGHKRDLICCRRSISLFNYRNKEALISILNNYSSKMSDFLESISPLKRTYINYATQNLCIAYELHKSPIYYYFTLTYFQ